MALFKPYSGTSAELAQVPVHDGYAYFTTDDSKLSVDINGTRYSANAKNADGLVDGNGSLTADGIKSLINNLSINTIILTFSGTEIPSDPNSMVSCTATLENPADTLGDLVKIKFPENVEIPMSHSIGFSLNDKTYMSSVPIENIFFDQDATYGGTELAMLTEGTMFTTVTFLSINATGTSIANIRNNLEVYSKTEVDSKLADVNVETYKNYSISVSSSGWTADGTTGNYKYVYTNTALKCGSDGNMAPIISYENDSTSPVSSAALDDYAKIYNAVCTAGVGITFYANAAITNTLTLKILDPQ